MTRSLALVSMLLLACTVNTDPLGARGLAPALLDGGFAQTSQLPPRVTAPDGGAAHGECPRGQVVVGIDSASGRLRCGFAPDAAVDDDDRYATRAELPPRVSGGCDGGVVVGVNADGTLRCAPADDDSALTSFDNHLAMGGCGPTQPVLSIAPDGTVSCVAAPLATQAGLDAEAAARAAFDAALTGFERGVAAGACAPTTPIQSIAADGSVTCVAAALATQGALDAETTARAAFDGRLATPCAAGALVTGVGSDGTLTCAAVGDGLTLARGTLGVVFDGSGTATTASRSDHAHADLASRLDAVEAALAELRAADYCPRLTAGDTAHTRRVYTRDETRSDIVQCTFGDDQMVKVGDFWIDRYEARLVDAGSFNGGTCDGAGTLYAESPGGTPYPAGFPADGQWSTPVYACSRAAVGVHPSASMTWFQAQAACAAAGKRLCRNDEWQGAVEGTIDPGSFDGTAGGACHTEGSGPRATGLAGATPGGSTSCISRWGAEDMIGNLWEWVADWQGKDNATGALTTNTTYGGDYMYNVSPAVNQGGGSNFPAAALRGGSWTSGTGAGAFAVYLGGAPSYTGTDIGARCCAGGR